MSAPELEPLQLPLAGRQVIEASAGTGKTWTLAALYVRLVLGHGRAAPLLPPQILVMTFTEAATAELRDRIRTRLSEAARYFACSAQQRDLPADWQPDAFLQSLRNSYAATDWPACALTLHAAADWMDEAAIYTIHGWSRRMLAQHALESHNLFEQTRLEDAAALQRTLTQDYWRKWFYPLPSGTLALIQPLLGPDPQALLDKIKPLWQQQERSPNAVGSTLQTPTEAIAAHLQWQHAQDHTAQSARQLWHDDVLQALIDARAQGHITGTGVNAPNFAKWLAALQQWVAQDNTIKVEVLERFTPRYLETKNWSQAHQWPFFAALQTHVDALLAQPDTASALAWHAAHEIGQAYQTAKAQRAAFDFSDLLQHLYRATHASDGRLAHAIRTQYPVALVDEFQDTDPWQYGTLHCIYDPKHVNASHAWVMIGDPKQAIYSFRGAELGTYLKARQDALDLQPDALHTLRGNRRSHQRLVNAVNHVFGSLEQAFACAQGQIDFVPVSAQGQVAPWAPQHTEQPAFHVWHFPCGEKPHTAAVHVQHMSQVFAELMAQLLNAGHATPGQMAVLVRGQSQADAIRSALQTRRIASVYLSDHASVYQSDEAHDLWRILRAIASPQHTAWVRSALGSTLWGLTLAQTAAMIDNETAWENLLAQCHRWRTTWQEQGLLPMLYQWLHSQNIAAQVLRQPEGERRLSNVLHLGELLQQAAQSLQGIAALVRYLEKQTQHTQSSSDTHTLRLETDAQCVQVITYHKSKGLQFPLVFMPFAGSFKTESNSKAARPNDDSDDGADAQATSSTEEDMRLLYVALTRAEQAVWLGVAETHGDLSGNPNKGTLKRSALARLLQRQQHGDMGEQLRAQWGSCPDISISTTPAISHTLYAAPTQAQHHKPALTPQRHHHSVWWTASFSSLTRGLEAESMHEEALADAQTDARHDSDTEGDATGVSAPHPMTADESTQTSALVGAWQDFPAGARYGTMLHDLLEWQALHGWPAAQSSALPAPPSQPTHAPLPPSWQAWQNLLTRKSQWLQLCADHAQQLTPWVQQLISTPLPLHPLGADLVLSQLPQQALWPEMSFTFEAHQLSSTQLDGLIQHHLFANTPRAPLQARTLNGMLTGFMDLVLQHDGKYWVLDYKSNRLSDYTPARLLQSVLENRYDVQYVLYTLALHRLLKSRLPNYDYQQHMGGCIYVYLRGIDTPGAGVHAQRPSQALIEALDHAFAQTALAPAQGSAKP